MSEQRMLKSMTNWSLKRIGSKLYKAFLVDGGNNYLELNFINDNTKQEYSVVVRPSYGMTPAQKSEKLTERVESLENMLKHLVDHDCINDFELDREVLALLKDSDNV